AYGGTNVLFDTYGGTLQANGETLALVQPATSTNAELVVAKVRYRNTAPWPAQANGAGGSLQLIDSQQDNWRVGHWAARSTNSVSPPATPGAPNGDATALPPFPPLWINELQPDNLTGITNRFGQRTAWLELYNPTANPVDLSGLYLSTNYNSLTDSIFPAGS